ncbi:MAG: hypothetical protein ACI83O_000257 [Patescibacteria group bacterium]|jgi:hypothetical protein
MNILFLQDAALYGAQDLAAIGALGGIFIAILAFAVMVWIYAGFALMAMAKRTNTPKGWLGFIPIANIYLVTQIGKQNGWWTASILLGAIPFIGGLASTVILVWLVWKAAEELDFGGWTALLTLIPIVNLVVLGLYAWGKPFGK